MVVKWFTICYTYRTWLMINGDHSLFFKWNQCASKPFNSRLQWEWEKYELKPERKHTHTRSHTSDEEIWFHFSKICTQPNENLISQFASHWFSVETANGQFFVSFHQTKKTREIFVLNSCGIKKKRVFFLFGFYLHDYFVPDHRINNRQFSMIIDTKRGREGEREVWFVINAARSHIKVCM